MLFDRTLVGGANNRFLVFLGETRWQMDVELNPGDHVRLWIRFHPLNQSYPVRWDISLATKTKDVDACASANGGKKRVEWGWGRAGTVRRRLIGLDGKGIKVSVNPRAAGKIDNEFHRVLLYQNCVHWLDASAGKRLHARCVTFSRDSHPNRR
jgi:hypothetical protein